MPRLAGQNEAYLYQVMKQFRDRPAPGRDTMMSVSLQGLADADLAQKIMDNMFTFDDLSKLDDKGFQSVLKEVQSESLVIALKGATAELREKVFKNMSSRAAETLREDLDSRGPVRVSDVEAEQKEMLKIVRRLVDEGTIMLATGGGDEFV